MNNGDKKVRLLIAGYPGIGKSTLALSAPRPLHIDVDFGIDRIEPRYRKPFIQPRTYDEICRTWCRRIWQTLIRWFLIPAVSSSA